MKRNTMLKRLLWMRYRLIRELNNDYVRRSEALTKEVKKMKWDHFHKIKKKDEALKSKERQVTTLKEAEAIRCKEQKHLRKSIEAKDVEIDILKEEIEGHMRLKIKNSTLKRKVNDLGEAM